jgi:hypothetical protein
LVKW